MGFWEIFIIAISAAILSVIFRSALGVQRSRIHHWKNRPGVRWFLAAIGFILLILIGEASWREIEQPYQDARKQPDITAPYPQKPITDMKTFLNDIKQGVIPEGKIIANLILMRGAPVMVETVVFNFPVDFDKSKQIKKKVESGELNLTLQFDRNSVNSSQTMIHASFKWQSGAVSMSSSGGFDINDALMGGFNLATNKPMFSAVYGETSNLHPRIILTGASQDDALPLTSVNEIIRSRGSAASDRVSFASKDMAMRSLADPTSEMVNMNFYFAGFMAHFQMAYIFAIISAGLISKLFRNSAAAFWALSFLCILYLAMWDRVALDHHLHEMNDPSHSVELRLTACSLTTNSFFYRNTAIKEIEAAMKQPGAPDELKQKGPEVINALKQWRQIQYMPGVDT